MPRDNFSYFLLHLHFSYLCLRLPTLASNPPTKWWNAIPVTENTCLGKILKIPYFRKWFFFEFLKSWKSHSFLCNENLNSFLTREKWVNWIKIPNLPKYWILIFLAACCTVVMLSPRMSMLPSASSRPRGPSSLSIGALLVSK